MSSDFALSDEDPTLPERLLLLDFVSSQTLRREEEEDEDEDEDEQKSDEENPASIGKLLLGKNI